jgi:GTP pyrophosphokinase
MVPLRHALANGDTVEVLTSAKQVPRKDWLEFVVTGKARSRIRRSVRAGEKQRGREIGGEILGRELRKAGLSLPRLREGGELETAARRHGKGSGDDLLAAIGYGRLAAQDVVRGIRGGDAEPTPRKRRLFRRPRDPQAGIRVSGQSDVLVRFGKCCAPIPGDEVVGFVTRGRGVTVHLRDCPKAFELDPDRRIEVSWESDSEAPRRIKMRVRSQDRPGLLAIVTKTIAARGVNIGAARITTSRDHLAEQTFDVWVNDVAMLNGVMKEISKIKGVLSVERLRS